MYAFFFLCGPELRDHHQKKKKKKGNLSVFDCNVSQYVTLPPEIFGFLFQP